MQYKQKKCARCGCAFVTDIESDIALCSDCMNPFAAEPENTRKWRELRNKQRELWDEYERLIRKWNSVVLSFS